MDHEPVPVATQSMIEKPIVVTINPLLEGRNVFPAPHEKADPDLLRQLRELDDHFQIDPLLRDVGVESKQLALFLARRALEGTVPTDVGLLPLSQFLSDPNKWNVFKENFFTGARSGGVTASQMHYQKDFPELESDHPNGQSFTNREIKHLALGLGDWSTGGPIYTASSLKALIRHRSHPGFSPPEAVANVKKEVLAFLKEGKRANPDDFKTVMTYLPSERMFSDFHRDSVQSVLK